MQKKETRKYLSTSSKILSKCVKDSNTRPETVKLLEDNLGKTLQDLDIGKDLLNGLK